MAIAVGESRRVGLSVLRSLVILLLLTFAPCGLRAQAVPAPAATASQASGPTFKLQVQKNEVVVRVVVRDSHGRAQAGLRQEDFKITDNGKPQTISSFSVQARPVAISSPGLPATAPPAKAAEGQKEEAPPLAPPAYLGLYFDDLNSASTAWYECAMRRKNSLPGCRRASESRFSLPPETNPSTSRATGRNSTRHCSSFMLTCASIPG